VVADWGAGYGKNTQQNSHCAALLQHRYAPLLKRMVILCIAQESLLLNDLLAIAE